MAQPFEYADEFMVLVLVTVFDISVEIWNLHLNINKNTSLSSYILYDEGRGETPPALELLHID